MQANPYRAEADDLRAKLLATTNMKQRRELAQRLDYYEREARRFDEVRGQHDKHQS